MHGEGVIQCLEENSVTRQAENIFQIIDHEGRDIETDREQSVAENTMEIQ